MAPAIHLFTNASGMADPYKMIDRLPLRSCRRAEATSLLSPFSWLTIMYWSSLYEIAAIIRIAPYIAVGTVSKLFSPIHALPNGTSDNQKSKFRFAHRILPV